MRAHCPLLILLFGAAISPALEVRYITGVCEQIAKEISSASAVFYPLERPYIEDVYHYISSSAQSATCSVEPGTAEDVSVVLQILGDTRTPFAVKGGGHASNPAFSSTTGVQIAMARFNEVNYNSKTGAVDIGPGLIWDDVYAALEPYGVNVVGGRVTGVGVAGFILGGGYSHKSNQYGLAIDTVQAYELVLPNGTITTVTDESNPDLFFALKGGFNNFGIVTKFTLKVFPQTEVWGGAIIILGNENQVNAATAKYAATVTDPKATLLTTYNWDLGLTIVELDLFYDAPTPPPGIFDDFLAIPALDQDISTRSFLSLVLTTPSNSTAGKRGFFHTVPLVNITPSILDAVVNESQYWADQLALTVPGLFISYDVEPFLPNVFSHGTPSAYPPSRTQGLFPMNIYYAWTFSASDAVINTVMQQTANTLTEKAIAEGQNIADAALYPNYAIYDTPLERMYGENMPTLQNLKNQYDPNNVMGLAGGWKF